MELVPDDVRREQRRLIAAMDDAQLDKETRFASGGMTDESDELAVSWRELLRLEGAKRLAHR